MSTKKVEDILDASEAVVGLLGRRVSSPSEAVAALAIALGRLCEHYDLSFDQALVLAKAITSGAGPMPPPSYC